ncbi:hypothetical protein TELCIR_09727 [Teladorsagia circumcincta]|uniref:W02B3.4-like N-terminal domain-containing protein n=1 Tax=Teladorsagia circumcincta TaxID=45464 RepID=A0A2G9UE10_TELCI|nr:hypothetical protein TELCIR_09727 [Teladorsagia circumcincta]
MHSKDAVERTKIRESIVYIGGGYSYYDTSNSGVAITVNNGLRINIAKMNCSLLLGSIDPPFRALLVDNFVLQNIEENKCQVIPERLRLAVDVGLINSIQRDNYKKFDIILYEAPLNKDYFKFHDCNTRITPRIAVDIRGNLSIPHDIKRFLETWKRSKFVDCLGLDMNRTSNKSYLPVNKTVETMSSLMNYLMSFDVYPILISGTLLGWYRECDIISHTLDADFAAPIEQYKPELLKDLHDGRKFFLRRKLGLMFRFDPVETRCCTILHRLDGMSDLGGES